ncbi:hypothetical protein [Bacillus sp. NPDC077027]|uniref:hypothetical protein n=1 Tax=Bacillus sp. NPDC077027 TaxID=3390548 RepID=UPI003D053854
MDAFEQLIGSLFSQPHDENEQGHEKKEKEITEKAKDLEQYLKDFGEKMDVFAKETEDTFSKYGDVAYLFKQPK